MINQFNEKGHPMVFGEESVNTGHLIEKCRAAISSLTHQHGMAERLAEACFMMALSELENNWKQHAEAAEAEVQRLNTTAQPVSAPEWTNEQCLEFLSIAFRHANISGDIEMDDIRLGIRMVNAAAPGGQDD